MNDLEARLREVLARREPSPGFRGRVLARLQAQRRRPARRIWPAAVLAASLALAAGLPFARRELNRRQGEQAKAQLILALDITQQKLALTERRLAALQERKIP
jgi:hypothetical protein